MTLCNLQRMMIRYDMDMENRPDMDIPTGLNATDFAASVPRSSSPKKDENNASDASSDLIVGEYVPPVPVRQCTCRPSDLSMLW